VFGDRKKDLNEARRAVELSGMRMVDLEYPHDEANADAFARADTLISGSNRFHNPRQQRRVASKGGLARAAIAEAKRAEIAAPWVITRMLSKWTYRDVEEVTGIPVATLKRNY
jgi:hypothetical protein